MDTQLVIKAFRPFEETLANYADLVAREEQRAQEVLVLKTERLDAVIWPLLEAQSEFGDAGLGFVTGLGLLGISVNMLSNRLYLEVGRRGAEAAVTALAKAVTTLRVDGHWIGALKGVSVEGRVDLADGLYLIPMADLPPSRNKDSLSSWLPGIGMLTQGVPATTCIVAEIYDTPWIVSMAEGHGLSDQWDTRKRLETAALALTVLPECTPILSPYWYELKDPDFAPYCLSSLMQHIRTGASYSNVSIGIEARDVIQAFEGLAPDDREVIEFVLRRLHSAKVEFEVVDKALDACICLEAMLSGDSEHEHTKAVKSRGELLVTKLTSGRPPSRALKKLLALRGKVAHGRRPSDHPGYPNVDIVSDGIELCEQVLGRFLRAGHLPAWGKVGDELISVEDASRLDIQLTN